MPLKVRPTRKCARHLIVPRANVQVGRPGRVSDTHPAQATSAMPHGDAQVASAVAAQAWAMVWRHRQGQALRTSMKLPTNISAPAATTKVCQASW